MRELLPVCLQVIASAILLAAAVILAFRLPPPSFSVTIIARDITVSGDY